MSQKPSEPMSAPGPKVFITYRREETSPHAGRLYDEMVARFGEDNVFMDVDMAVGIDFVQRITEAVAACQVLIVVMGPKWATVEDENGEPRIADPGDFVRLEVETALRRPDVTPIPVLVAGAQMPDREDLPPEVGAITRRNALELSDQRWRSDVGRLMTRLDELIDEPMSRPGAAAERGIRSGRETAPPSRDEATTSVEAKPAPGRAGRRLRWALLAAVAIGVIAVAVVVALGGGDSAPPAHFNAPDLKNLVLPSTEPPDEGTPGGGALTFKRSLEGEKARDALMDLPNVDRLPAGLQAAYVNHWGTFNPADEPDHADAAAAVFADETAARDAIAALSARWYGDAPLSTEGLGENGKAIVGSGKGFTDVVYAWQTGNLLQLVSVYSTFPRGVCGEERPCDAYDVLAKFARESADKMAALASNQNGG